jgi:hypothetical protein
MEDLYLIALDDPTSLQYQLLEGEQIARDALISGPLFAEDVEQALLWELQEPAHAYTPWPNSMSTETRVKTEPSDEEMAPLDFDVDVNQFYALTAAETALHVAATEPEYNHRIHTRSSGANREQEDIKFSTSSFSMTRSLEPFTDGISGIFHVHLVFNINQAPEVNGVRVIKGGLPTIRKGKKRRSVSHSHAPREPMFAVIVKSATRDWRNEFRSGGQPLPITAWEMERLAMTLKLDGPICDDSTLVGFSFADTSRRQVATVSNPPLYLSLSDREFAQCGADRQHYAFPFTRLSEHSREHQHWVFRQLESTEAMAPALSSLVDMLEFGGCAANVAVTAPIHVWLEHRDGDIGEFPTAKQGCYTYQVRDVIVPDGGPALEYDLGDLSPTKRFQLTNH